MQKSGLSSLHETTLASEQVYQGKLLDVRRDQVRLPDGSEGWREYIVHPGAVVMIPVLSDGRLLFERQHRYPVRQDMIELPAGKIDPDEPAAETAKRELREETGYVAGQWRQLGVLHTCVGYSNERIEVFLATDLTQAGAQQLDHGEFLELVPLSLDAALEMVRGGQVTDGKTVSALFWAEKVLRHGW